MGLESSVTIIADLDATWPVSGDTRKEGDDHLRYVKVALKSLLTNIAQIGLVVEEHTLVASTVEITTAIPATAGKLMTKVIIQDGTGGWAITWNAVFVGAPVALDTNPNAINIFHFVGRSNGTWILCAPPLLGVAS